MDLLMEWKNEAVDPLFTGVYLLGFSPKGLRQGHIESITGYIRTEVAHWFRTSYGFFPKVAAHTQKLPDESEKVVRLTLVGNISPKLVEPVTEALSQMCQLSFPHLQPAEIEYLVHIG